VSDPPERRLFDPEHRLLLVGLVLMVTVVAAEAMAVATVMPDVERDLGDLWLYGWVFSAFQLATLVGVVVGGLEVDRHNPARPLALGLVIFAAGLLVAGLAPSMPVVVAGRVLQGFGAGAVPTVAYACVGRGFAPALRPKVFAVLSTGWVVPSLVAPLLASWVAVAVGWRWVFLGLLPLVALAGGLAVVSVRSLGSPGEVAEAHEGRITTVVALVVGAGLMLSGLSSTLLWVGVPLAVVGTWMALRAFTDLTPAGTLSLRPRLPAAVGLRGMLTYAFFAADAFVALAVTEVRGESLRYAGLVLGAGALTWTAGSWFQARVSDSWGAARLVRAAMVVQVGSLATYAACLLDAVPVGLWFLGSALAGLGMGMSYSPLSVVTLAEAEPGREGSATTALQLSDLLGVGLGTGVAGAIVAAADRAAGGSVVGTRNGIAVVFAISAALSALVAAGAPRLVQATAELRSVPATKQSRS
jgi:MFS family permease